MVAADPVRRIGAYEILTPLKAGGMASLYLAKRTGAAGFSRHVAIKVVHPHLAQDPAFVRMFIDEARLTSAIQSPHVVHVEEFGEHGGMYYLVMEYVHGCALSQLLRSLAVRGRRLTPELATHLALQMADGLHAAHEARGEQGEPLNVVHRDVSPQNVLLSYSGHVKIIDFGIAKANSRGKETTTKSLKGKLRYMAPEQAFGRAVDRRTDVYALGVVLWEMLTVRRLFEAENDFALLDEVRNPKSKPPSMYAEGVPPALDAAVLRALSPDAAQRPQSMQEFRRLLAEAVPGASSLDAAHVADLLSVVMADDIEQKKLMVPESLSGIQPIDPTRSSRKPTAQAAEEVLRTMTWHAAVGAGIVDDDGPDAPAPQQLLDAVFPRQLASQPSILSHPGFRTSGPPSVTERIPNRAGGNTGLIVAVVGVGVVVIATVIGVGVYLRGQDSAVSTQQLDTAIAVPATPLAGTGLPPAAPPVAPPADDPTGGWGVAPTAGEDPQVDDGTSAEDGAGDGTTGEAHRPAGGHRRHGHDAVAPPAGATVGTTAPPPPHDTTATQHGAIRIVHDVEFE